VLVGWVADEGSSSATYGKMSATAFRADAQKKYGAAADSFLALYPAGDDAEASRSQIAAARDRNLMTTTLWAQAWKAHRRSPVYLYDFTRVPPWKAHPEFGAHHTSDVPYFFSTLNTVKDRDYTEVDRAVSHTASEAWVQFASTGKPGAAWTPVKDDHGPVFELGDTATLHPVLDAAHAAFWRGVLLKP
jgi:para-nitrobenzyl esterase